MEFSPYLVRMRKLGKTCRVLIELIHLNLNEMNSSFVSTNRSFFLTSTVFSRLTTSRIPHREQVLIDAFNTYIQIGIGSVLFLFGLTFNCLSLIYFRASRSFRHTTFQLYFSIIAILDTVRLFEFFIFILFDKGYLRVTLPLCRWIFFTIMFTGQASIWLTVALAVEKCIIIWFPIKGRLCFTISISKLVLIIVLCLVLFADIIYVLPNFFLNTYENISIHTFMCIWQTNAAAAHTTYDQWKKHYFTFNTIFFQSIIPSVLLLVINWLILCSLSRQRIVLSKIGTIDARHVLKREKQFKEKTIQLVLSSFFVIFTISPRYILTMVNAFAANMSKTPLMPLYIYVNLNTVFRVLEMSNYALNLMFAIMSGRTSRREIRKLLWECLFWRIHRAKTGRHGSRIHTHSFLFDEDDDDTERSIGTAAVANTFPSFPSHANHRARHLSRQNSHGNYLIKQSHRTSLFTCCGLTIDLSHKHTCNATESSSRHSTLGKSIATNSHTNPLTPMTNHHHHHYYYASSRRMSTCSHSPRSLSSFDRHLGQQKTISYKPSMDPNRMLARRRATSAVHCFRRFPTATPNSDSKLRRSTLVKDHESLISPMLQTNRIDSSVINTSDDFHADIDLTKDITHSPVASVQNQYDEQQTISAYVIQTC